MQVGGPIALVQDGDTITINVDKRTIDLEVSAEELVTRRNIWKANPFKATQGTLYKVKRTMLSNAKIYI